MKIESVELIQAECASGTLVIDIWRIHINALGLSFLQKWCYCDVLEVSSR